MSFTENVDLVLSDNAVAPIRNRLKFIVCAKEKEGKKELNSKNANK